ncbi:NAD(P)H pyrophosphatase NUDT13, mitochondrial [Protopterus annectens]|uniref:NAD(P)H pyrophosphatase NUDT13, mitochondrial n=1 Tax=Protopterus annectens TaxID=7888 RepID=UPI001CFA6631|nr:NAD(P)H pyrophosphatase NUDT13, mitochondrial [Protopterus annectens]
MVLKAFCTRTSALLHQRFCSDYVKQMRYLFNLKEDDDACRQALTSGTFYLFHNLAPLLQKSKEGNTAPQINASEVNTILEKMGQQEMKLEDSVLIDCSEREVAQFALDLGLLEKSALESNLQGKFVDLRKALLLLNGKNAPLLMKAQALLRWHASNQYCSQTGQPTQKSVSGSKQICSANGKIYYPQMSPVVITLVSDGSRCLLARQEAFPAGMYTALAGFCDIGETVEDAVHREVAEEVGLEVEAVKYTGSQHWSFPDSSLMIACHATVHPKKTQILLNKFELEDAHWFSVEEVLMALNRGVFLKGESGTVPVWVPPKWAIAHHLIQEWAQQQIR